MTRTLTCVVSARLKSARIKEKMVRPFAGSTLLEICLRTLLACPSLTGRVWVSAREYEIVEIARQVGDVGIWIRPHASLAEPSDCRTVHSYVGGDTWQSGEWTSPIGNMEDNDWFLHVNPCSPLLTPATIERAIAVWRDGGYRSLMGVVRRETFFFDHDGRMLNPFLGTEEQRATLETKLVGTVWEAGHALYIWPRAEVIQHNRFFPMTRDDPFLFPLPPEEALDIDEPFQWERAEILYQNLRTIRGEDRT